ncbi:glycosyltransferase [Faecalimonas umbilicata]|nr:glycosyltransferase [Faecalimonas umbilicata]
MDVSREKYTVIANGIDIKKFVFNEKDRKLIRQKYKIGDRTVIGHVGRFTYQKNHTLIIDIFSEYHKNNPESVLMLVGEGEDKEKIWNYVLHKGLFDDVIFTGAVPNVWSFLSAMDKFLFPSLYEGLGIALLEAQACNLPCLISDMVPKDGCLSNCVSLKLGEPVGVWATQLEKMEKRLGGIPQSLIKYDVHNVVAKLQAFYLKE